MTGEEIENIEKEIEEYNKEREKEALEKFKKGPIPKMKWTMDHLLESLLRCISAVKFGLAPDGLLGFYVSDELARVLSTRTFLSYEGLSLDENAAIEADPSTCFEDVSNECTIASWTPEFGQWRKVLTALCEYLYTAAVFAKSVNATSTAARLYLRAWHIAKQIEGRAGGYSCATQDEALSIVRLERVAADRLWVDAQFAALPPFKKAKEPRSGKVRRAKKAK